MARVSISNLICWTRNSREGTSHLTSTYMLLQIHWLNLHESLSLLDTQDKQLTWIKRSNLICWTRNSREGTSHLTSTSMILQIHWLNLHESLSLLDTQDIIAAESSTSSLKLHALRKKMKLYSAGETLKIAY